MPRYSIHTINGKPDKTQNLIHDKRTIFHDRINGKPDRIDAL